MRFLAWSDIWQHRDEIEADLHEHYGLDLSSGILARRTARWLRVRVQGLLQLDGTRIARELKEASTNVA